MTLQEFADVVRLVTIEGGPLAVQVLGAVLAEDDRVRLCVVAGVEPLQAEASIFIDAGDIEALEIEEAPRAIGITVQKLVVAAAGELAARHLFVAGERLPSAGELRQTIYASRPVTAGVLARPGEALLFRGRKMLITAVDQALGEVTLREVPQ